MTSLSLSSVSTPAYFIVLPIAYFIVLPIAYFIVLPIAYFIVLSHYLTSLQCRQHYLRCCPLSFSI